MRVVCVRAYQKKESVSEFEFFNSRNSASNCRSRTKGMAAQGDGGTEWCHVGERALYTDKRSLVSSLCKIEDIDEEFCEITLLSSVSGEPGRAKETETVQLSPITPDPAGKTVVFDFDQTLTKVCVCYHLYGVGGGESTRARESVVVRRLG